MSLKITKRIIPAIFCLLFTIQVYVIRAQSETVRFTPDGMVVMPRDTMSISTPEEGMIIYDNTSKSFWYHDGFGWRGLQKQVFKNTNDFIRPSGEVNNKHFSMGLIEKPQNGGDVTIDGMYFNGDKNAIVVGANHVYSWTQNDFWSPDSIGYNSINVGRQCVASGLASGAFGTSSSANGLESFALGFNCQSKGTRSFAFGSGSKAMGSISIAMGSGSQAIGGSSVAIGHIAKATGNYSVALGHLPKATGLRSICLGQNEALGSYSEAHGLHTKSAASLSTTFGRNTVANGIMSTVIGMYNDTIVSLQNTVTPETPLFIVGNGINVGFESNAFVVRQSGAITINDSYDLPTSDGDAGQVLSTNGNGQLSWVNGSSSPSTSQKIISYNDFSATDGIKAYAWPAGGNSAYLYHFPGQGLADARMIANVVLENGQTIDEISYRIVDNTNDTSLLLELLEQDPITGAITILSSTDSNSLTSSSSFQTISVSGLSINYDSNKLYFISIKENSSDPYGWYDETLGVLSVTLSTQ